MPRQRTEPTSTEQPPAKKSKTGSAAAKASNGRQDSDMWSQVAQDIAEKKQSASEGPATAPPPALPAQDGAPHCVLGSLTYKNLADLYAKSLEPMSAEQRRTLVPLKQLSHESRKRYLDEGFLDFALDAGFLQGKCFLLGDNAWFQVWPAGQPAPDGSKSDVERVVLERFTYPAGSVHTFKTTMTGDDGKREERIMAYFRGGEHQSKGQPVLWAPGKLHQVQVFESPFVTPHEMATLQGPFDGTWGDEKSFEHTGFQKDAKTHCRDVRQTVRLVTCIGSSAPVIAPDCLVEGGAYAVNPLITLQALYDHFFLFALPYYLVTEPAERELGVKLLKHVRHELRGLSQSLKKPLPADGFSFDAAVTAELKRRMLDSVREYCHATTKEEREEVKRFSNNGGISFLKERDGNPDAPETRLVAMIKFDTKVLQADGTPSVVRVRDMTREGQPQLDKQEARTSLRRGAVAAVGGKLRITFGPDGKPNVHRVPGTVYLFDSASSSQGGSEEEAEFLQATAHLPVFTRGRVELSAPATTHPRITYPEGECMD